MVILFLSFETITFCLLKNLGGECYIWIFVFKRLAIGYNRHASFVVVMHFEFILHFEITMKGHGLRS